ESWNGPSKRSPLWGCHSARLWNEKRAGRCGRGLGACLDASQNFLGYVEALVGGDDDARLCADIEDHRVVVFSANLLDDFLQILHERTNELGLPVLHLLVEV